MPLFSPTPFATGIRLAEPTAAPAQSRPRKQFNTLMKKLDAERLRLAAWHQDPSRHGSRPAAYPSPIAMATMTTGSDGGIP